MIRKQKKKRSRRDILFDNAWSWFSEYIKRRDKYICITCGATGNQAGHFVHGKTKALYFNEYNVHAQCVKCNYFLSGNREVYLREIQRKYGIEKGDELLGKRYEEKYWGVKELEKIIEKYKKKACGK